MTVMDDVVLGLSCEMIEKGKGTKSVTSRRRPRFISHVICDARKGIDGHQVPAHPARQKEGSNREVLVMTCGDALTKGIGLLW